MNTLITSLLANKHTSSAGAGFLACKGLGKIATAWWPNKKEQIDTTVDILEGIAVAYGLGMAGDASKSRQELQDVSDKVDKTASAVISGDTTILTRDQTKP